MKMEVAFLKDGTTVFLRIIGHIKIGTQIGIDKYGRCYRFCKVNLSASEYNPELDGPIRFDI